MSEHLTYLALTLGWALPPILLQWLVGLRLLARRPLAWALGILIPTVYLVLADSTALGIVWSIAPGKSTGLLLGNVPLEEVVFFLVTNTLVVQSILLAPHARELAAGIRYRFSRLSNSTKREEARGEY